MKIRYLRSLTKMQKRYAVLLVGAPTLLIMFTLLFSMSGLMNPAMTPDQVQRIDSRP